MKGLKDIKNGRFVRNLKDKECPICGKIFIPRLNNQKYCSKKCSVVGGAKILNRKKGKICEYCGKEYLVYRYRKNESKFCSHKCYVLSGAGIRRGKDNNMWNGGTSFEPYTTDWTQTLKRSIRERDKYICQVCGEQQGDRAFAVHHIDYDKRNCNTINLITLCNKCHMRTNFNRNHWTNYFKQILCHTR